jgi:predicted ArsR family transcriptional regulator
VENQGAPAGDVLTQPTRAKLFELLATLRREAGTEELAERLGLHVNGVRRQLERLQQAGLVARSKRRHGRGRPRDFWSIAPGAEPGGRPPTAYDDLAGWLAGAIPPGPSRLRQVERTGREIGRALAPAGADDSAESFEQVLSALGFQPQLRIEPDGEVCCRLGNCPYRDAVRQNQQVVCTLHKGLTAGLLDRLSPQARLDRFEPHDPDRAGCVIGVANPAWS